MAALAPPSIASLTDAHQYESVKTMISKLRDPNLKPTAAPTIARGLGAMKLLPIAQASKYLVSMDTREILAASLEQVVTQYELAHGLGQEAPKKVVRDHVELDLNPQGVYQSIQANHDIETLLRDGFPLSLTILLTITPGAVALIEDDLGLEITGVLNKMISNYKTVHGLAGCLDNASPASCLVRAAKSGNLGVVQEALTRQPPESSSEFQPYFLAILEAAVVAASSNHDDTEKILLALTEALIVANQSYKLGVDWKGYMYELLTHSFHNDNKNITTYIHSELNKRIFFAMRSYEEYDPAGGNRYIDVVNLCLYCIKHKLVYWFGYYFNLKDNNNNFLVRRGQDITKLITEAATYDAHQILKRIMTRGTPNLFDTMMRAAEAGSHAVFKILYHQVMDHQARQNHVVLEEVLQMVIRGGNIECYNVIKEHVSPIMIEQNIPIAIQCGHIKLIRIMINATFNPEILIQFLEIAVGSSRPEIAMFLMDQYRIQPNSLVVNLIENQPETNAQLIDYIAVMSSLRTFSPTSYLFEAMSNFNLTDFEKVDFLARFIDEGGVITLFKAITEQYELRHIYFKRLLTALNDRIDQDLFVLIIGAIWTEPRAVKDALDVTPTYKYPNLDNLISTSLIEEMTRNIKSYRMDSPDKVKLTIDNIEIIFRNLKEPIDRKDFMQEIIVDLYQRLGRYNEITQPYPRLRAFDPDLYDQEVDELLINWGSIRSNDDSVHIFMENAIINPSKDALRTFLMSPDVPDWAKERVTYRFKEEHELDEILRGSARRGDFLPFRKALDRIKVVDYRNLRRLLLPYQAKRRKFVDALYEHYHTNPQRPIYADPVDQFLVQTDSSTYEDLLKEALGYKNWAACRFLLKYEKLIDDSMLKKALKNHAPEDVLNTMISFVVSLELGNLTHVLNSIFYSNTQLFHRLVSEIEKSDRLAEVIDNLSSGPVLNAVLKHVGLGTYEEEVQIPVEIEEEDDGWGSGGDFDDLEAQD